MPDTVFKAVVKIPFDTTCSRVGRPTAAAQPQRSVPWMLPDGFKLAPEERLTEELQEANFRRLLHPVQRTTTPHFSLVGRSPAICTREIVFFRSSRPIPGTDSKHSLR